MTRLEDSFRRFHDEIRLSDGTHQQIAERLERLRTVVQKLWRTSELIPIGSYARGTLVPPPRDVDLMFVLGDAATSTTSPIDALQDTRRRLREEYPNARIQKHSVGITFDDFSIDVVPALTTAGGYRIPELDDANNLAAASRWVDTKPREHTERVAQANRKTNGIAGTLIATLKHMNYGHDSRLKSFHVETMALDALDAGMPTSQPFPNVLLAAITQLATRVGTACVDSAGGRARIDQNLDGNVRRDVANRYANDAGTLGEAMRRDDVTIARRVVPGLP